MKLVSRLLLVLPLASVTLLSAQPAGPGLGGPRHGKGGPGRFHPVLRVLDANRDAEISAEEIAAAPTALRALDANQDGAVTFDELRPPRPADAPARPAPPPGVERRHPLDPVMLALDANQDRALSAEEINRAAASLGALDANGDGKLTHDEVRPLPPVKE